MRRIKIAQIIALLFTVNVMTLAALHNRSFIEHARGHVSGTVIDLDEARVSAATITIEGEGLTQSVATADDGTFQFELPVGTYRIRAARTGFCPIRRAPFRTSESSSIIINFTLIPCPIVNDLTIKNGKYVGETDRYKDPFKEEVFAIASPNALLELLVRYGSRQENQNTIEYRGAFVSYESASTPNRSARPGKYLGVSISYDSLMIRADKIQLDPKTVRLEAEGNVVVEDGRQRTYGQHTAIHFESGKPIIKTIP